MLRPIVRQQVRDIARKMIHGTALETFKSSSFTAPAIKWMEDAGIIESGRLSPSVTTLRTRLAGPILCQSCNSRMGIQKFLQGAGWNQVESSWDASLSGKLYNQTSPLEYFLLLKFHLTKLEQYEAEYPFRHSQSKAYYDTFLVFFEQKPTDTCLNIKLSFIQLQLFSSLHQPTKHSSTQ